MNLYFLNLISSSKPKSRERMGGIIECDHERIPTYIRYGSNRKYMVIDRRLIHTTSFLWNKGKGQMRLGRTCKLYIYRLTTMITNTYSDFYVSQGTLEFNLPDIESLLSSNISGRNAFVRYYLSFS